MAKSVGKSKTTKTKAVKSKAMQSRTPKTGSLAKVSDMSSKGVGKYVGKTNISKRAFKLESKALKNERLGMQGKPAVIRAAGEALAMNTSPAFASYGVGTGIAAMDNRNRSQQQQISDLINGGANIAGRENDEELNSSNNALPGGMVTR